MRARVLIGLALTGAVVGAAACGSVPDITFVDLASDGGGDASTDASGAEAASDGSGGGDGFVPPADGSSGCPAAPPAGFDGCCGSTPCRGTCTAATCGKCGACAGIDVCCARNANPMCKAPVSCN